MRTSKIVVTELDVEESIIIRCGKSEIEITHTMTGCIAINSDGLVYVADFCPNKLLVNLRESSMVFTNSPIPAEECGPDIPIGSVEERNS